MSSARPRASARSDQDFVLVALGNRGDGGVVQDGRETVIHPGEFALYDTTRPYELKFNDAFTQTIFKVPREMLQRRLGRTEAAHCAVIRRRRAAGAARL